MRGIVNRFRDSSAPLTRRFAPPSPDGRGTEASYSSMCNCQTSRELAGFAHAAAQIAQLAQLFAYLAIFFPREAGSSESQLMRYFGGKAGLLDTIFNESWAACRIHST